MEEAFFWTSREFLENILQKFKNNFDLSICNSSVKNASDKGDNYISRLFRVTVKSENPAENNTLFVKIPPDEGIVRDMIVQSSAFSTEIRMYRDTLPEMNKVLARKAPHIFRNLGPECYYMSGAEEPLVLIIEDLSEKGYVMGDRRKGLDLEHCLLVMKTLARFHACSLAVHADNPSSIESYTTNLFFEESAQTFWKNCFKSTLTTMAKVVRKWDGFGEKYAERLRARAETMRDDLVTLMSSKDDAFKVLVHGDLWVNNVLFRYDDETGVLEDAMLIDFQFCFFTSPGIDLQNFITTSPVEHVRVNHTEDLLREYHAELCGTLQLLGQGDKVITFQQLLEEYENKSLYGAFIALLCLPVIMSDPSDACDFESLLRDEVDEAVIIRRVLNEDYARVLKRLLLVFESKRII